MRVKKKRRLRSDLKKRLYIALIIFFVIVLIVFGTKFLLYLRIFLGNDLLINLNSNKDNFNIINGESDKIVFNIKSVSNVFCKTECEYKFLDLSKNKILGTEKIRLNSEIPIKKEFTLLAEGIGEGQDYYRFDLECKAIYSQLCPTSRNPTLRSSLITVNRQLNNKEVEFKTFSIRKINDMIDLNNDGLNKINNLNSALTEINKTVFIDDYIYLINSTNTSINNNINNLEALKEIWDGQDFYKIYNELKRNDENFSKLNDKINELNLTILGDINEYNIIINKINIIYSNLSYLKTNRNLLINQSKIREFNNDIREFNEISAKIERKNNVSYKKEIFYDFAEKINSSIIQLYSEIGIEENNNLSDIKLDLINSINIKKINLSSTNFTYINIVFNEPKKNCCLFGNCGECCEDESCKNDKKNYPILFLHGHSFSKQYSAEYSLDSFDQMQKELEKDGYLNAGIITLYSNLNYSEDLWTLINYPISLRTSYYFDVFKDPNNPVVIQTKSENIDNYAIRLKEIIEVVKEKTGRPKVILISHSMGGLVARRYLQLFGENNVYKLILIGTPNKGIIGTSAKYCGLFGENLECKDMEADSLFMNKLNNDNKINIPVYNLIGIGCDTDGYDGDGIVIKDNAFLDKANNIEINGRCDSLNKFHSDMTHVREYPEIYNIIKKILGNESV